MFVIVSSFFKRFSLCAVVELTKSPNTRGPPATIAVVAGVRIASHVALELSVSKRYELAYFTSHTNDFTASP